MYPCMYVCMYVCMHASVYVKRFTVRNWMTLMEAEKSTVCSWQARIADGVVLVWVWIWRQKTSVSVWKQSCREKELFLSFFVLFRPSVDWLRPTYIGRMICFTQATDSNINLIQKHPHRNTQNNARPNSWAPYGPIKLTCKINHHAKSAISLLLLKNPA